MHDETIAVAVNDIDHIKTELSEIKADGKDTKAQAIKTNGRMNRMEERHAQEDLHGYPERIHRLEKYNWRQTGVVTAVMTIATLAGWGVVKWSVGEIVKSELAVHKEETRAIVTMLVEDALEDYEFVITE